MKYPVHIRIDDLKRDLLSAQITDKRVVDLSSTSESWLPFHKRRLADTTKLLEQLESYKGKYDF